MTPRENLLEVINWGKPEYVPIANEFYICGMGVTELVEQPRVRSGKDPYGVDWIVTSAGPMHDTTKPPLLKDIADWKSVVRIPDIDQIDFEGMAEAEMAKVDRSRVLVAYFHSCGVFERLVAFMGFENALIALAEDPDSCMEFFEAITDYKIKVANRIIDAYKPDVYVYFDDVASARNLFISPETYRRVIKPFHARTAKAVIGRGLIYSQHTCGKCEALLEDYVEIGAKIWHAAQIMNDLPGIQRRFKGRLVIEGGWDSSGRPGHIDASEEEVRAEVRRAMSEYGKNGGFILMPVMFNEKGNSLIAGDPRMAAVLDEWNKCRYY